MAITRTAFRMIREDPALLVLPVIAGLTLLGIFAVFIVPVFFLGATGLVFGGSASPTVEVVAVVLLLTMYFVLVFVGNLFNGALIGMASMKLDGKQPTVGDGLRFAAERWKALLVWSLIAASIGLLIRLVASRFRGVEGLLIRVIAGATWSLGTYFVIPVVVFEGVSGFRALKRSWEIFSRAFGRTIVTNLVVGVITVALVFGGVILAIVGIFLAVSGSVFLGGALFFAGVALFVFAVVLSTALEGIVRASLYRYAVTGHLTQGLVPRAYLRAAPGFLPSPPPPPPPPPPSPPPLPSARR